MSEFAKRLQEAYWVAHRSAPKRDDQFWNAMASHLEKTARPVYPVITADGGVGIAQFYDD